MILLSNHIDCPSSYVSASERHIFKRVRSSQQMADRVDHPSSYISVAIGVAVSCDSSLLQPQGSPYMYAYSLLTDCCRNGHLHIVTVDMGGMIENGVGQST